MLKKQRTSALCALCVCLGAGVSLGAASPMVSQTRQGSEAPEIVSREAWGASPADVSLMAKQTPRGVVIHHTSVRRQPRLALEQKLRGLQHFSQTPGQVGRKPKPAWGDVPYHYYIDAAGRIGEGRDPGYAGDTNTAYDPQDKIQIAVEGDFEHEQPDAVQLQALARLLAWLAERYAIAPGAVASHNDFAQTDCPGRNLKASLPAILNSLPGKAAP